MRMQMQMQQHARRLGASALPAACNAGAVAAAADAEADAAARAAARRRHSSTDGMQRGSNSGRCRCVCRRSSPRVSSRRTQQQQQLQHRGEHRCRRRPAARDQRRRAHGPAQRRPSADDELADDELRPGGAAVRQSPHAHGSHLFRRPLQHGRRRERVRRGGTPTWPPCTLAVLTAGRVNTGGDASSGCEAGRGRCRRHLRLAFRPLCICEVAFAAVRFDTDCATSNGCEAGRGGLPPAPAQRTPSSPCARQSFAPLTAAAPTASTRTAMRATTSGRPPAVPPAPAQGAAASNAAEGAEHPLPRRCGQDASSEQRRLSGGGRAAGCQCAADPQRLRPDAAAEQWSPGRDCRTVPAELRDPTSGSRAAATRLRRSRGGGRSDAPGSRGREATAEKPWRPYRPVPGAGSGRW